MFRLNKLTDYALVVMQYVASHPEEPLHTARALAAATELPVPTVVKILKELMDHSLLVSHRGAKGGYAPARRPSEISVAEIVEAFEGSIGFTECATAPGRCDLEGRCKVQDNSTIIGHALQKALGDITLSDLTATLGTRRARAGNIVTTIRSGPIAASTLVSSTTSSPRREAQ